MSPIAGKHFIISGKVQGVWYRASTKTQAQALHITGWVRNLPNGDVEVVAYGEEAQLQQFHAWLKQGPPQAQVSQVTVQNVPWQHCSSFDIT